MDMNRTFFSNKQEHSPEWHVIDAQGKVLGRIATEIADRLRGKDEPQFTRHADTGDYIIVINADKVKLTGRKMKEKEYVWYTGWMGGQKRLTADKMQARKPDFIIRHAVKGMLPKNRLARQQLSKLKIYTGKDHPHQAQTNRAAA